MDLFEIDILFAHTKKHRFMKVQSSISTQAVIKFLLHQWVNPETDIPSDATPFTHDEETRRFEKDLQELVDQDTNPSTDPVGRRLIRERSYSPPPAPLRRFPPPPRFNRPRNYMRDPESSKTEYWRPWGSQSSDLYASLRCRGWQPVYMRGTDAGQTWFYGQDVVHVRRFTGDYTPQEDPIAKPSGTKPVHPKPAETEPKPATTEYLIISTEWIEEEATQRIGFAYQVLPSGYVSLDPRITWGDIRLLIGATSTFREERLYRKYRSLPGGDLCETKSVAVPHGDFLHGPKLSDLSERVVVKETAGPKVGEKEGVVNRGFGETSAGEKKEEEGNHGDDAYVRVESRRVL
jgi:hypothetical protein